jgi:putative ABC transport system ATP-binding protein
MENSHSLFSPIHRYWKFLKADTIIVKTLIYFCIVGGFLFLSIPVSVNILVSNLAFGNQTTPFIQTLLLISIILFALLFLSGLIKVLQYYLAEIIQRRLFFRLAKLMSEKLPRINFEILDKSNGPEMVNHFFEVITLQKGTTLLLMDGVTLLLGILIGLTVLSFYHPFLLAFSLFILFFVFFVVFFLGRSAIKTSINESLSKYKVIAWLEEIVRLPLIFKGPDGYNFAKQKTKILLDDFLLHRSTHFQIWWRQIIGLIALEILASSLLLLLGGWLVLSMQLTIGQLVAAEIIVSGIIASIAKMGKHFEIWYDLMAAVEKINHLIELPIEDNFHANKNSHFEGSSGSNKGYSVTAHHIGFYYEKSKLILKNISFHLKSGEALIFTGHEGSGCSTLFDLISGLRKPTEGYIQINQLDIKNWALEDLHQGILLLRQFDFMEGTIQENLCLNLTIDSKKIESVLEKVGLLSTILSLPRGIETKLNISGFPLSQHQKIRFLIARALILEPKLLLIDGLLDLWDESDIKNLMAILNSPDSPWTLILSTRKKAIANLISNRIHLGNKN